MSAVTKLAPPSPEHKVPPVNGKNCIRIEVKACQVKNRKALRPTKWTMKTPLGEKKCKISEESKQIWKLELFLLFGPSNQLHEICTIKKECWKRRTSYKLR